MRRPCLLQAVSQRGEQEAQSRKALLAVNHEPTADTSRIVFSSDVNNRA
jgi:hypothetical protein